jgi:hypothetical protein
MKIKTLNLITWTTLSISKSVDMTRPYYSSRYQLKMALLILFEALQQKCTVGGCLL